MSISWVPRQVLRTAAIGPERGRPATGGFVRGRSRRGDRARNKDGRGGARTKNLFDGDVDWIAKGIPAFFTGREKLRHPEQGMDDHIANRLSVWRLEVTFRQSEIRECEPCARCFARFVMADHQQSREGWTRP